MESGPIENGTVIARLFSPRGITRNEVTVNLSYQHGVVIDKTEMTPLLHLGYTLEGIGRAVHDAVGTTMGVLASET